MELVNFSVETHQGPFLNVNEDGYDFDLENELYMIFDGFGGNGVGDKVVKNLQQMIKEKFKNFVFDSNATLPFFYSPKYLMEANALVNAAMIAHESLQKENLSKEMTKRGGASAILAAKYESVVSLLTVGNCRSYLLRRGEILPVNMGDSFRLLTHDTYDSHLKNVPLSGFGLFPELHYQVNEVRVIKGDKLILMTDGVYGRLTQDEIHAAISKYTLNIKTKIHELFHLSNNRGNLDNQTCMILEF